MRLTKRDRGGNAAMDCDNCEIKYRESCCSLYLCRNALIKKLAAYEDAEEQGRLVILPCKVGDKVRDKIADYVFTVEQIELGHKAGTLFRCGNPGTEDYMAFYDFEIGENIEILTREEAEAALKGERNDV